jgi:hypothetical protein
MATFFAGVIRSSPYKIILWLMSIISTVLIWDLYCILDNQIILSEHEVFHSIIDLSITQTFGEIRSRPSPNGTPKFSGMLTHYQNVLFCGSRFRAFQISKKSDLSCLMAFCFCCYSNTWRSIPLVHLWCILFFKSSIKSSIV